MQRFPLQTAATAPEKCKPILQALEQKFGFLPNAIATMANSPTLLGAFVGTFGSFHGGSFDGIERQVLLLANAVTLQCPWTIAAHSTFAAEEGLAESEIAAIRRGELPKDAKYAALCALTRAMIERRGKVGEAEIGHFTAAGYAETQILEVVAGIGVSTMAATTTNLAGTPIEDRLKGHAQAFA
jgi:alkylhydroperoxidase family enzyme